MELNTDFHIHSKYSSGVSEKMELKTLSVEGKKKGIDLLGTGDCLHPRWRKQIKELKKERESIFTLGDMNFIPTAEVETKDRVHHLCFFPSLSKVEELYERMKPFSSNIDSEGRPRVDLSGEELALMLDETGCLFGPAHAFTPYTGIYGNHDSLSSAYGKFASSVDFLELGLSADSSYADKISELHDMVYLSNSDAHSPFPYRLAREFNTMKLDELSFEGIKKLFEGKKGEMIRNVGLPPEEGKYNESACESCQTHHTFEEAVSRDWRCSCGGSIKKGVSDRVEELSDLDGKLKETPPYLPLIPLQEIIAKAVGHSSPNTKKVKSIWQDLIHSIGDEVEILCDSSVEDIEKVTSEEIANLVKDFREGNVKISPGGGGEYGEILPKEDNRSRDGQRSLTDF
ncbi:MAG: TIGR00375 family protein [Candidatus Thermoplasmatota archaeon]|nr:TIGR00375 family protein [Candidatus Thermoplasmatota archaeon]